MPSTGRKRPSSPASAGPPAKRPMPEKLGVLGLPLELFRDFIHYVVDSKDIQNTLNVRYVCHTFKREIDTEIFWSGTLDKHVEYLSPFWLGRLLREKAMGQRHRVNNAFFQMLRDVNDEILKYCQDHLKGACPDSMKTKIASHVTALSSHVRKFLLSDLRNGADADINTHITSPTHINRACICVAAHLGWSDMYHHFQAKEPVHFKGFVQDFGSPAWAAALAGRANIIQQMRAEGSTFCNAIATPMNCNLPTALSAACTAADDGHRDAAYTILATMLDAGRSRRCHADNPDVPRCVAYALRVRNRLAFFELLTRPDVIDLVRCELEEVLHVEEGDDDDDDDDAHALVELLLQRGVDPDTRMLCEAPCGLWSTTPLQNAIARGDGTRLELRLAHGAHLDDVARSGREEQEEQEEKPTGARLEWWCGASGSK